MKDDPGGKLKTSRCFDRMLELVKRVSMVGSPTSYSARVSLRKKDKSAKNSLVIRPSSLLCAGNSEDYYGNNIQQQSNTWKFHKQRPSSLR